jgi:hypothetical protein
VGSDKIKLVYERSGRGRDRAFETIISVKSTLLGKMKRSGYTSDFGDIAVLMLTMVINRAGTINLAPLLAIST